MPSLEPLIAAEILPALQKFVMATKLHPILVNFTAALVPVSIFSDGIGRIRKNEALCTTGWWALVYATAVTPFTAIAGWLFWMKDDVGVTGMTVHKWLGTAFVLLLFGLIAWRRNLYRRQQRPTTAYLITGALLIAVLVAQGYLGGRQVFSDM